MKLCLLKMKFVAISVFYLFNVIMAQRDITPLYRVNTTTAPSNFQGFKNVEIQESVRNLIGDIRRDLSLITSDGQITETLQQNRQKRQPSPKETIFFNNPFLRGSNSGPAVQPRSKDKIFFNNPFLQGSNSNPVVQPRPKDATLSNNPFLQGSKHRKSYFTTASSQRVPIQRRTSAVSSSNFNSISRICGRQTTTTKQLSAVIPLIIEGEDAPEGANPWLAALFRLKNQRSQFICGSTIISTKHVITAGHCVNGVADLKRFYLALGTNNIYNRAEFTKRSLSNIYIHPEYALNSGDADVAVLVMSKEVQFTTTIAPACLWNNNVNNFQDTVGTRGLVAGWGIDESGSVTAKPKQITMPIVSEEDCLRSADEFFDVTSNRTFCAGSRDNSGPCKGDSGGGFYVEINGVWYLRGIVSHSLSTASRKCDLSNYLVFTDIAQHAQWIMTKVTD